MTTGADMSYGHKVCTRLGAETTHVCIVVNIMLFIELLLPSNRPHHKPTNIIKSDTHYHRHALPATTEVHQLMEILPKYNYI